MKTIFKGFVKRLGASVRVAGVMVLLLSTFGADTIYAQRQMEKLDRGLVVTYIARGKMLVSWRIFGDDPDGVGFNVYAFENGGDAKLQNDKPITGKSNLLISGLYPTSTKEFYVVPVVDGEELAASKIYNIGKSTTYLSIPLNIPEGGTNASGSYTYTANDCSVGDLDGDGDYELIVKWDPTNSKDNSQKGYTGNVYLDAYTIEGEQLWRIDLGKNIRAGAHYTQFMVYDLDGDGKAEVSCKTAPGTKDASEQYITDGPAANANHSADYRNSDGYVLSGPEYFTIFNGFTGKEMATRAYVPQRGSLSSWGDTYGNRVDRFLACVAYLDGERPSLVMCRGYYRSRSGAQGRTVLSAWDFRDGELTNRWNFNADRAGENKEYAGQGNHQVSVADVDADGKDEIVYGAMTVDDDGTGLYNSDLHHGDALHVSDIDPSRPGLEIFSPFEEGGNGVALRDAETGESIWHYPDASGGDIGRGMSADIIAAHPGMECWASGGFGVYNTKGEKVSTSIPSINSAIWWDGDLLRELLDGTEIFKYKSSVFNPSGCASNNSTKKNPCLSADILGDWREELIVRKADNSELRIYCTNKTSEYGFYTLMHDPQYRLSVAWQNVAYNQPPHTSFYLGTGMDTVPTPDAYYVEAEHISHVGIDDNCVSANRVQIYPVPASENVMINVTNLNLVVSVSLIDMRGKTVRYIPGYVMGESINCF